MSKENDTKTDERSQETIEASSLAWRWQGPLGKVIREAGAGGGFVALPYVLDDYERALGLEPMEMWLLKRLLRHYWKAGQDVCPSFEEIAQQANISRPTLRKLRNSLAAKGLIRITGPIGKLNGKPSNRVGVNLFPLWNALYLCILCDPNSKIVRQQRHADLRRQFSLNLGTDETAYGYNKFAEEGVELPVTIEQAKEVAAYANFTLDWNELRRLQGEAAQREAERDNERYERRLEIKQAIQEAANGKFGVNWGFEKAYRLLTVLVDSSLTVGDVYELVAEYAAEMADPHDYHASGRKHSYKAFEAHVLARLGTVNVRLENTVASRTGKGVFQHINI